MNFVVSEIEYWTSENLGQVHAIDIEWCNMCSNLSINVWISLCNMLIQFYSMRTWGKTCFMLYTDWMQMRGITSRINAFPILSLDIHNLILFRDEKSRAWNINCICISIAIDTFSLSNNYGWKPYSNNYIIRNMKLSIQLKTPENGILRRFTIFINAYIQNICIVMVLLNIHIIF